MGSIGANSKNNTSNRTITREEVQQSELYTTLVYNDVKDSFADGITRAVMQNPDSGNKTFQNYDFYNLTGREFNTQINRIKSELKKAGYDVEITDSSYVEGGELRYSPGRGMQRQARVKRTQKTISYKRR